MELSTVLQNRAFDGIETTGQLDLRFSDIDQLYHDLSDLVNESFRLWYLKKFNEIGRLRILELASQARADGQNAKKLFSFLLLKEGGRREG